MAGLRDGRLVVQEVGMSELSRVAGVVILAVVLASGCTVSVGTTPGAGPEATGAATADPPPGTGASRRADSPGPGNPAGRGYPEDVRLALRTVVEYWEGEFAEHGRDFTEVREVTAYEGRHGPRCGAERIAARNAAYCSGRADFIAYDTEWLGQSWTEIGDTFVYLVIGHEYGHAVQARLGLTSPLTVKSELQADCFAGAYLAATTEGGRLARGRADFEELFRGLGAVADRPGVRWFDTGAHGSALQRRTAFFTGYLTSSGGCTTAW